MAVDPATFLDLLRDSGLLDNDKLQELARDPAAQGTDPQPLARLLLKRGWLTRFQINHVLHGHGKDLSLGPYRLLDRIGEGGMGQIFKAYHKPMNRVVALKVIRRERLSKPGAVERFGRELELAARLSHPNIVLAYDAGHVRGTHYLAMEYVDGVDLGKLVRDSGPLPVLQACDYVRQAALGLQHAYERGLVHRDIKPSNLLLARAPGSNGTTATGTVIKILDMGLARWEGLEEGDTGLTREGQIVGTPDYLAPEQARNSRAVDIRADLYSLGCTFYFLLTGRHPFRADSLAEVLLKHQIEDPPSLEEARPDVPPAVRDVVRKLMAKRPEDRFQTPAELAEALAPLCRGEVGPSAWAPAAARMVSDPDVEWELLTAGVDKPEPRGISKTRISEVSPPGTAGEAPTLVGASRKKGGRGWTRLGVRRLVQVGALSLLILALAARWYHSRPRPEPAAMPGAATTSGAPAVEPAAEASHPAPPVAPGKGDVAAVERPAPPPPIVPMIPDKPVPAAQQAPFEGHTASVKAVALSFDGAHALSGGDDATVRLWDVATGKELHRFTGHAGPVTGVAFAPDGRRALSSGLDKTLRLWDVETGAEVRRFDGHTVGVWCVAFSRDGRRALSGGGGFFLKDGKATPLDCTVRLWDVDGGKELRRFEGHTKPVRAVAFSPDGLRALSASDDRTLRLWDVETGGLARTFDRSTGPVLCLAFSPDGRRVLSGGADRVLRLWDLDSGSELRRLEGHTSTVWCVGFSPDGRHALSGSGGHEVKDGQRTAVDCMLHLWDVEAGRELGRLGGTNEPMQCAVFFPDGRRALSGGPDRVLHVWDLAKATPPPTPLRPVLEAVPVAAPFEGHTKPVVGVAFTPDGLHVLTASQDKTLRLWDAKTGKEVRRFLGHAAEINCLALSPDGRRAASGDQDGSVRVWDIQAGQQLRNLTAARGSAEALAFSPDGRRVYFAGSDGIIRAWVVDGGIPQTYRVPGAIHCLACSPDGKLIAFGGADGNLHLWEVESGREPGKFLGQHAGAVLSIAFSPDGGSVLTGGNDRTMRLWKVSNGKEVRRFSGHKGPVASVAFSADGKFLLSGCGDKVVRLWDVRSGALPLRRFEDQADIARCVAFSPDGRRAASGGDGIKIWDLAKPPAGTAGKSN